MLTACLLPTFATCAHLQRAAALDCIPSRLRLNGICADSSGSWLMLKALSSVGTRHTGKSTKRACNASYTDEILSDAKIPNIGGRFDRGQVMLLCAFRILANWQSQNNELALT